MIHQRHGLAQSLARVGIQDPLAGLLGVSGHGRCVSLRPEDRHREGTIWDDKDGVPGIQISRSPKDSSKLLDGDGLVDASTSIQRSRIVNNFWFLWEPCTLVCRLSCRLSYLRAVCQPCTECYQRLRLAVS